VLGGVFLATGAAATLIRALNRIHDVHQPRSFLTQRMVGLAITVALFLALASLAVLIVAGGTLQDLLLPDRLQVPLVTVPLAVARYALALLVLVALFGFVYSVGPNRIPPRWQWLSPGAVVGVLSWLVVAGAFRVYTVTIGARIYDEGSYGAVAGVIVFLLWLQLSMLAMLTGAELNAELERLRADRQETRQRALHRSDVPSAMLPSEPVEAASADDRPPLIRRVLTRWSGLAAKPRR
jgi:membrane protein